MFVCVCVYMFFLIKFLINISTNITLQYANFCSYRNINFFINIEIINFFINIIFLICDFLKPIHNFVDTKFSMNLILCCQTI